MLTRANTKFSKIGFKNEKWHIEFEYLGIPNSSAISYVNNERPRPEFREALSGAAKVFQRLLRLHELINQVVDVVHFKFLDNVMHIQVEGRLLVDDLEITAKTQKIPETATDKIVSHLTDDEIEIFETLQDEAIEYLNGNRSQLALGFDGGDDEPNQ